MVNSFPGVLRRAELSNAFGVDFDRRHFSSINQMLPVVSAYS